MAKKQLDLTEGRILSVLAAFVLPMILGSLIQQLYITADAVIVGRFAGKVGLAAIDSVHTLFKFPLNFMNGLASGATIIISGYFGAKNDEELNCSVRTAFTIAMGLGLVCSAFGVLFTPRLLQLMSVPEDIFRQTLIYTRIYFGGIWAMILYNMSAGIMRALGDSKRPLYVLIICSIANILGDIILVGGFKLGVGGAAAATVGAQIISVFCTYNMLGRTRRDLAAAKLYRPNFCAEHMVPMIKIGFPLALQSMLFPIANSIVQASVNKMGTDAIAAWGICDKLEMLIWLIADAMSPALTTYVAQNLGAEKKDRVTKGVYTGTAMSTGAVAFICLGLFFFAGPLGKLFISEADAELIIPLVIKYIKMLAPFFVFYAVGEALSGACCGLGDTFRPMVATLLSICLLRVLCIWFVLPSFYTMECIVWIYIASWIAVGVSFFGLYQYLSRKKLS
ncbi:MAG: MATE family efflux transporter [Clostridia bacterium]|nr:MATE family efflux transporter [Clostridia bacterium]